VNIVAFRVMGNDHSVSLAAHHGQLQLNAYEPLAGLAVIESQSLLYRTSIAFRTKCIDGITVNEKVLARYMETTVVINDPPGGISEGWVLGRAAHCSDWCLRHTR
jgi:aspartate ammonia-lyase